MWGGLKELEAREPESKRIVANMELTIRALKEIERRS